MTTLGSISLLVLAVALLALALSIRIVKQYEQGVVFRLGRVLGPREPPLVTLPVQSVIGSHADGTSNGAGAAQRNT